MTNRFFPNYDHYIITSRFGQRVHPITKIKTMHKGIDLTATNDGVVGNADYITAHSGGQVEAVGYGISAGYYVKIRVDSETLMVYYHLKNKSTLEKGSFVARGAVLGYMGKTGSATGAPCTSVSSIGANGSIRSPGWTGIGSVPRRWSAFPCRC